MHGQQWGAFAVVEIVKIHGLKELEQRLKALPDEITKKGAGGPLLLALRRMGAKIQKDAKSRVAVDTGTLRDNIITTRLPRRKRKQGEDGVQVTVRAKAKKYADNARNRRLGRVGGEYNTYGPLFYARFLEFGTSKMAARPFLTPAFEAAKRELPGMFQKELARAIDDAVKKLAKRSS